SGQSISRRKGSRRQGRRGQREYSNRPERWMPETSGVGVSGRAAAVRGVCPPGELMAPTCLIPDGPAGPVQAREGLIGAGKVVRHNSIFGPAPGGQTVIEPGQWLLRSLGFFQKGLHAGPELAPGFPLVFE